MRNIWHCNYCTVSSRDNLLHFSHDKVTIQHPLAVDLVSLLILVVQFYTGVNLFSFDHHGTTYSAHRIEQCASVAGTDLWQTPESLPRRCCRIACRRQRLLLDWRRTIHTAFNSSSSSKKHACLIRSTCTEPSRKNKYESGGETVVTDAVQAVDSGSNKHVPAPCPDYCSSINILVLNHRQAKRRVSLCKVLVSLRPDPFLLDCPPRVWHLFPALGREEPPAGWSKRSDLFPHLSCAETATIGLQTSRLCYQAGQRTSIRAERKGKTFDFWSSEEAACPSKIPGVQPIFVSVS